MKQRFNITGMGCAACVNRIETEVGKLPGVSEVSVNLLKNNMNLEYDEHVLTLGQITDCVADAGYGATPDLTDRDEKKKLTKREPAIDESAMLKRRFFLSLIFTLPLFIIHMFDFLPFFSGNGGAGAKSLTMLLLCIPVIFLNREMLINGFTALFKFHPNMFSLIAVGSGASFIYGVYIMYRMMYYYTSNQIEAAFHLTHEIYFESAAMILTLITLGKFLEARAKRKTSSAVNALLDLTPQTATVEIGGIESVIPIEEISKDDIVIIRAGETIPADGIIKEGSGSIDESMLTGESLPVDKAVENRVTGGTLLKSGFIKVTVTAVGNESALARIIALVDDAASSKAPVQHLADKISGVFVPVIIGLAIVTLGVWLIIGEGFSFALARAVSVLVISCPCALGLATPAAISAGTGAGAKMGILSKSAEALETMYKTDTVVFDKTGTITEGKPRVAAVFNGVGREIAGDEASYILTPAVSIELQSGHPLAKAVIDKCDEDGILPEKVRNYRYIDGRGVAGEIGDDMYMGGNRILMREAGIDVSDCHDRENSIAENGQIPIYFSKNKNLLGILAMSDTIRPSAIETVKTLQKSNIDVVMLTGDNERTAKAIAKSAGIENVVSGVLPDGKDGEIMKLREAGKTVMMVGDGINDAPALTRADIGVAVGNGTDVAIEAADIIIMRNDLTDIPKALNLSRKVMRIIKQNLFWAFIYNIIGIPIAAGILYPIGILLNPMFAAAAMSVSSVTVVVNALRLQTQKSEVRSQKSERRSNAANTLNKD